MSQHSAAGLARDAQTLRDLNATTVPPSLVCCSTTSESSCGKAPKAAAPSPFSRPSGHVSALTGSLAGPVMPLCQLCTHLPPAPGAFWTSGDTKQHTVLLLCQVGTLFFVVVGFFFFAIFSESAKEAALKMGQIWIILFFPSKICNILIVFCPDISSVSLYSSEPQRHQQQ